MKKFILVIASLSFGLSYSQTSKKPNEKSKNRIPKNPYHQIDSTKSIDTVKNDNRIGFYKNVDSAKASKYKILSKKPSETHSQLQHKTAPFSFEKKNDTTIVKKNK